MNGFAALFAVFLIDGPGVTAKSDEPKCSLFNYEVERRVKDQLAHFLSTPQEVNQYLSEMRKKGGFPSGSLRPSDRDLYLKMITSFPVNQIYFAEDSTGFLMGHDHDFNMALYREGGNSGYDIDDPAFTKYFNACIDPSGNPTQCLMGPGQQYIKYADCEDGNSTDCDLYEPCPDPDSQSLDCDEPQILIDRGLERDDCLKLKKWCRKYSIEISESIPGDPENRTGMGYVPFVVMCINENSEVTQTAGDAFATDGSGKAGTTCVYTDGVTPVQTFVEGDFEYCRDDGSICNGTYTGAFFSPDYDGRYRPWYVSARVRQHPHWTDPYLYESGFMGLTHVHPVYTQTERGQRFDGVMGIDYKFEDFASFLVDNYKESDMLVAIFEAAEPNYVISLSTGTTVAIQVLVSDPSKLCSVNVQFGNKECITDRATIDRIGHSSKDDIVLREAYRRQESEGYPKDLLFVKTSDEVGADIFVCQSTLFELGDNLSWRILTVSPAVELESDVILPKDPFFAPLIFIALVGMSCCACFLTYLCVNRKLRAIAYADWKFTACFVGGCGLLNAGSLTLLGENTEVSCLLRMWFFHFFFVVALSALFVKAWRLYRLTGGSFRRTTITNTRTAFSTLPFILTQTTILLIFTFVDPPKPTEIIETNEFSTRRIVCQSETDAFMIAMLVMEAGMVAIGCVLAYLQRNLDDSFGETKQMLIAMYNIALVGMILLIVINVADMNGSGMKLLQAIGVMLGSVVSAAAFVVPRMLQIRKNSGRRLTPSVKMSGDFASAVPPHTPRNGSSTSVSFSLPVPNNGSNQLAPGSDVVSDSMRESAVDASGSVDASIHP